MFKLSRSIFARNSAVVAAGIAGLGSSVLVTPAQAETHRQLSDISKRVAAVEGQLGLSAPPKLRLHYFDGRGLAEGEWVSSN